MLAHAIIERFVVDGVEHVRHHAGIVPVDKYEARSP